MQTKTYSDLSKKGVFAYGTKELKTFEARLAKYFTREYKKYNNCESVQLRLDQGPLTLSSDKLAEDHYDEALELFSAFLDTDTMAYSMAYFDEDPKFVLASKKSLSQAQIDKFKLIAIRMQLLGTEHLLNIGCGYGYFENYLLNVFPELTITSITHSKQHYDSILERKNQYNNILSTDRFRIFYGKFGKDACEQLGDLKYDVVCSIGLMEHINNIELFFELISRIMTTGGRMFHHLIVSRDLIPQFLDAEKTMIGKYFPGGKVLPYTALRTNIGKFTLMNAWFINGMNYWKTLDMWHANFWLNINSIYPERMDSNQIQHWNDYFVLCKAMFYPELGAAYGNGQYLYRMHV